MIGKTDEAAALCAEVYYAQAEDAMKAEDYAVALDYYRSAGDVENAAAYTSILAPPAGRLLLHGCRGSTGEQGFHAYQYWWSIFKEQMGEPEKLADVLVQEKVSRLVNNIQAPSLMRRPSRPSTATRIMV